MHWGSPPPSLELRVPFPARKHRDGLPFWEWDFLDGHLPLLPADHAAEKEKGVRGRPVPGGYRGQGPWTSPPSPSLSQASETLSARWYWDLVLQMDAAWNPPGPTDFTCPGSDRPPPPRPQGSDSDLYPRKLMGQSGYDFFSI